MLYHLTGFQSGSESSDAVLINEKNGYSDPGNGHRPVKSDEF
jgi:hypothetical protein